jgi:hypothetical protein
MTFEPVEDSVPSFSKDGAFIYFASKRSGVPEIWKMPASGGDAVQVTRNGGVVAFESRDGHLYYTQTYSGPSSLWRLPTDGSGRAERVLEGVGSRSFQVIDGAGIYYIERPYTYAGAPMGLEGGTGLLRSDERSRLRFFDIAEGKSRSLADIEGSLAMGLAVSPDGRTVLWTRIDSVASDLMMVENFK